MLNNSKIILIGNYIPDKQESMERFLQMLKNGYYIKGISKIELWYPTVFFGKFFKSPKSGIGKWLSYVDKYLIFPIVLFLKSEYVLLVNKDCFFHICDHSNSPYIYFLPKNKTLITCHDVLAIRGAFGFQDAYCTASLTGKILQKGILNSLFQARKIAFVSQFTMNQFLELQSIYSKNNQNITPSYQLIYNGFNAEFERKTLDESEAIFINNAIQFSNPFLLHIGSSLPRKNRKILVELMFLIKDKWSGSICFAGQKIEPELETLIKKYNLQERILSIEKPSHELLVALYSSCLAFLFPSFSEGFGWPLIEAQACGAPVITSNLEPMKEVCGDAAIFFNPNNPQELADAFFKISKKETKDFLIEKGYLNSKKYSVNQMIDSYLSFYNS